jgi:hypothetical protein
MNHYLSLLNRFEILHQEFSFQLMGLFISGTGLHVACKFKTLSLGERLAAVTLEFLIAILHCK